jgi:hypothetical protein
VASSRSTSKHAGHDDDAGRDNMCVGGAASELRGGRFQPGRCYRRHQPDQTKPRREKEILLSRFPFTTTFSLFSRPSVRGRLLPEKIRETFSVLDSTATENRLGGFVWPEIDAATVKVICTRPPSLDRAVFSPIVWRVTRQNWQVGRVGWRRGRRRDGQR